MFRILLGFLLTVYQQKYKIKFIIKRGAESKDLENSQSGRKHRSESLDSPLTWIKRVLHLLGSQVLFSKTVDSDLRD